MPDVAAFFGTILLRVAQGLCEGGPTLVVGLFTAGYLRTVVGPVQVRHLFGRAGWGGIARSTILGCLLPVCSIGVLPVLRQLRAYGVPTSRLLSFGLAAPLLNPITVIYGLTTLEFPVFLLIIAVTVVVSILAGWITGTWYEAPLHQSPDSPPPVAWGWRRMSNVLMASAHASVGPFWRDAIFALFLSGLSAACFPPRFLSGHLSYRNPEAPLVGALAALLAYVAPATGVMQVSAMAAIQFSLGAAVAIHVFGVGMNAAVLWWVVSIYGLRRLLSLGLLLGFVTLGIGYAADASLAHPPGSEVDSYALDLYTRSSITPEGVLDALQRTSLSAESRATRQAALMSLGMLIGLTMFGAVLRLARLPLLSDPVDINELEISKAPAWNRPLPKPVLRLLGIAGIVGLSVHLLYVYYPPPKDILEEMRSVRANALAALNTRDWDLADRELSLCDYHVAKLPMAAAIRGGSINDESAREVAELRGILAELRVAAQTRRAEVVLPLIAELRTRSERCRDRYLGLASNLKASTP